jgi:hypothetical protein
MTAAERAGYVALIERYLGGELAPAEFQAAYLARFAGQARALDPAALATLVDLFGDVDAFVADAELRAALEAERPGFYLDEPALRRRVAAAHAALVGR